MPTDGSTADLKLRLRRCFESESVDIAEPYVEEEAEEIAAADQVSSKTERPTEETDNRTTE